MNIQRALPGNNRASVTDIGCASDMWPASPGTDFLAAANPLQHAANAASSRNARRHFQLTSMQFCVKSGANGDRWTMCAPHALDIASLPDATGSGSAYLRSTIKTTAKTTHKTV